jgi:succinyl-diaminopimelate desuccinylase
MRYRTTHDREEFEDCLDYIRDYFADTDVEIQEHESDGYTSLLIHRGSPENPGLLLHGHIDVVEAGKDMFEPEREDGKIYGRGSADMKAGVACIMEVMKNTDREDVALLIVSDEEIGGFNGLGSLKDGLEPDFAISAEPNNTEGYLDVVTKQKGVLHVEVSAEGSAGHASRPWKGENAAEKLIEKYNEISSLFADYEQDHWVTTCNLGTMDSGKSINRIPDEAGFGLDIRYSDQYDSSEVISDLENIPGIGIEVMVEEPMLNTSDDDSRVRKLQELASDKGESSIVRKEPASDMRFFSGKSIPAVVFGPEGYNSHASDEYAVISSFGDYCEILEKFIEEM